jgi:tetratricopeptide (TPR) repeat protein
VSFRKAVQLAQTNCNYTLHLAESLYFLAAQQKLNWENFEPSVSEANSWTEFKEGSLNCDTYGSYLTRLRTLRGTFSGVRVTESVTMIHQAIDLDPQDSMNWIVLSQLRAAPPPDESKAPSERAAELEPELALVQYELGNYRLAKVNQESFAQAQQSFLRTKELSPRHFQAILGMADSLSLEADEAAGQIEPLLKEAVEIAPASLKARMALGDYYAGLEETEKALDQYHAATNSNPKYYPAFLSAGTTLVTAERPEEAENLFDAVLQLEPNKPHPPFHVADFAADAQAHYYLGNIWLERGDLEKARGDFDSAIRDISNYALAIYGLGIVSYQEGKLDEALRHLNQVIQLGPREYPNAYFVRGGIRADRGQFSEGLSDLDLAIEIYREQATALDAKAKVDEKNGFTRRAEGERRRKAHIESTLEKALQVKKTVEALKGGY